MQDQLCNRPEGTLRYGILIDTKRLSVIVIQYFHHQQLLELILSDDYSHMVLYRTQYLVPTDEELSQLEEQIF